MEYNYTLTTEYDGNIYGVHRIADFTDAAEVWSLCVDSGDAKTFARYIMTDPTGSSYSKSFYVKS